MLSLGVREMASALRVVAKGDLGRYYAGSVSETDRFEQGLRSMMGVRHEEAMIALRGSRAKSELTSGRVS